MFIVGELEETSINICIYEINRHFVLEDKTMLIKILKNVRQLLKVLSFSK